MYYEAKFRQRPNFVDFSQLITFSKLVDKLCLSPFDCKRYILPDGIRTLAFRHRLIGH